MSDQMETPAAETTIEVVDVWESAETDALAEFGEAEAVTDDEAVVDEPVTDEVEAEEPIEATDEVEAVEDEPVEPVEEVEPLVAEPWNGDPATLPEELKGTHLNMVRGVNKKLMEVAELRKDYEAKLEAINAPKEEAVPDGPPELPAGDNVSTEEWNKAVDERQRWFAKDAAREERESQGKLTAEQDAVTQSHADAQARFESLQKAEGFTDEVAQGMAEVAEGNPYWAEQLRTSDEGTNALFRLVKQDLEDQATKVNQKTEAADKAAEVIRAKASAGKRGVSRPAAAKPKPQDVYMNSYEAAEAKAMEDFDKM